MRKKRSRIVLPHDEYKQLCKEVHTRDAWRCASCRRRNNLHAHHIIFRSHGGDDASWNMITLCTDCHDGIHKPVKGMLLVIVAKSGKLDEKVNADDGVKFVRLNGWTPKRFK